MGKKWVKNGITGVQKTALMHASAGLAVVNFAWTFHPSFVIVKPLLLSASMVLFVTMQM